MQTVDPEPESGLEVEMEPQSFSMSDYTPSVRDRPFATAAGRPLPSS
jgi:hypothetical protein